MDEFSKRERDTIRVPEARFQSPVGHAGLREIGLTAVVSFSFKSSGASVTPMKLNIHLECFAMSNDLLTEKTTCQVLFCQRYW